MYYYTVFNCCDLRLSSICARLYVDDVADGAELLQTTGGDDNTILAQEGRATIGPSGKKDDVLDLDQVSFQIRQLSTSNVSQS